MPAPAEAGSYRAVLRLPHALRVFAPALGGRLAYGLLPLATLFTVRDTTGSFAAAGLALALFGLTSITLPVKARFPKLLPWMAPACAASLSGAALTAWPVPFVALAGLAAPPLGPAMRAAWRRLTEGSALKERAYALDAVAEETLYLVGPLLAGLLIAVAPARWALLLTALLLLLGTLGMTAATRAEAAARSAAETLMRAAPVDGGPAAPRAGSKPVDGEPTPSLIGPEPVDGGPTPYIESEISGKSPYGRVARLRRAFDPGPLRIGELRRVLVVLMTAGGGISVAYTATAAAAQNAGRPGVAGLLEGGVAAGSVTGGLLWARRRHTRPRSWHLAGLLAILAIGLLAASAAPGLLPLGLIMAVAGVAVSPLFVVAYLAADDLTPPEHSTEAGTWVNVAANAGNALGSAGAGLLTDRHGPSSAFLAAGIVLAVTGISVIRCSPNPR